MNLRWILTLAAATLITGCNDFPNGLSRDRHHFVSTPHVPINVALVDTMTGKTLFKMDVPVNHELIIDLDHPDSWTPGLTPAIPAISMSYSMKSLGIGQTQYGQFLDNDIKLPGNPVIMKVTKLDVQRPTAAAPKSTGQTIIPTTTTPAAAPAPAPVPPAPVGPGIPDTESTPAKPTPTPAPAVKSSPAPAAPASTLEPKAPAPKPKLGATDTDKSME